MRPLCISNCNRKILHMSGILLPIVRQAQHLYCMLFNGVKLQLCYLKRGTPVELHSWTIIMLRHILRFKLNVIIYRFANSMFIN